MNDQPTTTVACVTDGCERQHLPITCAEVFLTDVILCGACGAEIPHALTIAEQDEAMRSST